MKPDDTLDQLLAKIRLSLQQKKQAERAIVKGEEKRRKAHMEYLINMDTFRNKEYII